MTQMRIADIAVGERRREDLGDIAGLAASIDKYGLIHAVVVDPSGRLVAGGRRLAACESLGMTWVEVRQWDELTDAELREIELEENLRRKDLTPYEASADRLARAMAVRDTITSRMDSSQICEKTRRGAPPKHEVSLPHVAREMVDDPEDIKEVHAKVMEIGRAMQHVEVAESFPVFQKPDWKQYHVLEARTHLESIPADAVPAVIALIDQPATPPKEALKVMASVAAMPDADRQRFVAMATSADSRERSRALTDAVELPAMPDPRLTSLRDAVKRLSVCVKEYPNDPMTPRIDAAMRELREIVTAIKEAA